MRKALLSMGFAALATCAAVAQNGITEIPDANVDGMQASCISANGKYVAGCIYGGATGFIYDRETKEIKLFPSTVTETDPDMQIRGVSNSGLAVGWDGPAATFDYTTGTEETLGKSDQYLYYGISPNGLIVGARFDDEDYCYQGVPCYFSEGKPVDLPVPSDKFLGYSSEDGTACDGAAALQASNDSLICGFTIDFGATRPSILWTKNRDNKTFSAYPYSRRYFIPNSYAENPVQDYYQFSNDQSVMSPNGKYIALFLEKKGESMWETSYGIAKFNTETEQLETYFADADDETFSDAASDIAPCAISDDGTMVGYYGSNGTYGFIWKAGESNIQKLADAYPGATRLAEYDGQNMPCAISADGRYISGFAWTNIAGTTYNEDDNSNMTYVSYVLDTEDPDATAAVEGVKAQDNNSKAKIAARYDISGKMLDSVKRAKGLVIVKRVDGTTQKVLVK